MVMLSANRTVEDRRERALQMHDEGHGIDAIATDLGVRISTVVSYLKGAGRRPGKQWEREASSPDYSNRPGPIRCTCGAPTPHASVRSVRGNVMAEPVDGIPWGFCSVECSEAGFGRLCAVLGVAR